jgi:UDP-N-acetylmuramoylalanine--D-glutamate ligase
MATKLVILGAGESGVGAAILGKKKGFDVLVSDAGKINAKYRDVLLNYDITFEEGVHTKELILEAGLVVKSPGIPDHIALIKEIKGKGIPMISEIEFGGRYCNAKTICITGSNGKTTTTMLAYHMLQQAGLNVGLAGNVGNSFAWQVAEKEFDYYVIELSSFQLDGMFDFKADIAVLLNITPDHLDRYDNDFQKYVDSKFRVLQNQTKNDFFIYWAEDPVIQQEIKKRDISATGLSFSKNEPKGNGAGIKGKNLIINREQNSLSMSIFDIALQGQHNTYNSMAAGLAGMVLNIRNEKIRESLSGFQGVEHRLEHFLKVHGIAFVNDSKATNVNSTWYALESLNKPIVWIAGGVDKGNDYESLKALVKEKVKAIICLGVDNKKIIKAFEDIVPEIHETQDMKEAVRSAYYLAKNGETVVLSPACASFDLFENYEDRGRQFKLAVREL